MKTLLTAILTTACLAGCSGGNSSAGEALAHDDSSETSAPVSSPVAGSSPGSAARPASSGGLAARTLGGRTGELVDPDNIAVVFLYYDLAGLQPPIDDWVELDNRVQFARPPDKQAQREAARAEYRAAAASVRGVGLIRLSMVAQLSEYDPQYSEFRIGAFAPSSVVNFRAFDRNVSLKFGNGRDAQLWRIDPSESRAIRDRIGHRGAYVEALLAVTGVQPASDGGALVVDVVEYELRQTESKHLIARVQVAAR